MYQFTLIIPIPPNYSLDTFGASVDYHQNATAATCILPRSRRVVKQTREVSLVYCPNRDALIDELP
jgi:hypothetical protein